MSDHPMAPIAASETSRAVATLISAFAEDPAERWLYPDYDDYVANFPEFVEALGEPGIETSSAWQLDDFAAVALWIPPGVRANQERIATGLLNSVDEAKHADMIATLEQLDVAHPRSPHWYLALIGVEASKQGNGLGTRLLAASLDYIDVAGLPAYLETRHPRNEQFFGRHGFKVLGRTEPGPGPAATYMLREGRG